jgi:hypothetical protein
MPGTFNRAEIDEIFEYHAPSAEDLVRYQKIRAAAKELALTIAQCAPPSPDRSAAIRKVREAVMTANAAVALKGKF